jgi:PAS domain S-box-containing protein
VSSAAAWRGFSANNSAGSSSPRAGLPALFSAAFKQSKNAMLLVDGDRTIIDANGAHLRLYGYGRDAIVGRPIYEFVVGGPTVSKREWNARVKEGRFTGETKLLCADGSQVVVQWAATTEQVTGSYLVLFVAMATSRWGVRFRRTEPPKAQPGELSQRELEIVRAIAFGSTGPEIADELQISHHTVRTHVRNAMSKVDARSRAHLVAKTLGDGMVLR